MEDCKQLQIEFEDEIAHVTLDSQSRMNALDPDMAEELFHASLELGESDARCITLTGNQESYGVGADLAAFDGDQSDARKVREEAS